ncbi:MAG TPA: vitamin B12-dependent ribonucleotide reductase [Gemmatimonadales bacterium]|nr:vitamin B12-dependent ribonucleotide reductase [Gemmatimonadales bacterium]
MVSGKSAGRSELELSANALTVLERRYLVKNEAGQAAESPDELFRRVARTIAAPDRSYGASDGAAEALAEEFFRVMAERKWMPNSPTLMNAGRPLGQLSACFVLPVDDALSNGASGIYDTLRAMALVHQSGGGTGFAFSRLRPKNDVVRSTMGVASGPVSFMKLYDASTDVVKQGGTRRGANMGILRVDHPDILDFVACKDDTSEVTNFNISVAVTDEFMAAVAAGTKYELRHPRTGRVTGKLDAREVFDRVVAGAWKTGEPGVFFVDRANRYNPVPQLGAYEATNPCGEQPLLPYDVCNLGSINLGLFVRDQAIQWDDLRQTVHLCTHFLDNVIDANKYPLPEIDELAKRIRRVGLGVMGWADMLVRLGVPYNSDAAVEFARQVMAFVDEEAKCESERLAEQRGTFSEWERSIWGPEATCARDARGERIRPMRRLRNCNLTTVAPTGTISIIAGCSSGIEPLFAVAFLRNQAGTLMPDVNEDFVAYARAGGWYSEALMQRIAEEGHIHFPEVPELIQHVFVTAHDVTPEWHIRMQAAFQDFTDSAISKTCNFPETATRDDVRRIYEQAYSLGCKGVTVYRDNSRPMQVLSTGKTAKEVAGNDAPAAGDHSVPPVAGPGPVPAAERELAEARGQLAELEAELGRVRRQLHESEAENAQRRLKRSRPDLLRGMTRRIETPLGTAYVTITEDERGQPFEVFISLGKAGAPLMADVEAIGRLISLSLRSGIPMAEIHRQLRGISSDRVIGLGPNKVMSVPDAIGIAIEKWMQEKHEGVQQDLLVSPAPAGVARPAAAGVEADGTQGMRSDAHVPNLLGACPDCGSQLEFAEGCVKCHVCGYSECG